MALRADIPERMAQAVLGLLALALFLGGPAQGRAQSAAETRSFSAAVEEFEDGLFDLAEKDLGDFLRSFPGSTHGAEAILYQAQAGMKQGKFRAAIDLLKTNAPAAGAWADRYRYRLGEAYLESTNYLGAAETFASLLADFPSSNWLLAASYGEASARFKLHAWSQVVELLQQPNRTFRKEALLRPADEFAMRGALLLVEALLEQKDYPEAERALGRVAEGDLIPELKWYRQYLLCRLQLGAKRPREALASTTNLLTLATASAERYLLAESVALQGTILEQLDDLAGATQVYQKNLQDTAPVERAREALLKIGELALAQGKLAEAMRALESFLVRRPDDAASEVVLLTLGELHLRQHLVGGLSEVATNAAPVPGTNQLQQALFCFERLITNSPPSALAGKAQLGKGWVLWVAGKTNESQAAFQLAAAQLPRHSEEQAVARFKLAEAQFSQEDYTNALVNFRAVLDDFSDLPRVREALAEQALYQTVRASLRLGDLARANEAMKRILEWYPGGYFSDRAMLLVGQHLTSSKKPAEARALFRELNERFPSSPLAADIEIAIARTYVEENDWPGAIGRYESWLTRFPTNASRPEVEFHRAQATYRAGGLSNAITMLTNLVARFPAVETAARAQFMVASLSYNQGDFESAEKNFQSDVLTHNTNYVHRARMAAGRAAVGRQGFVDAANYFKLLIDDKTCPPDIKVEAYFALGDAYAAQAPDPTDPLKKFSEAAEALEKIPTLFKESDAVSKAWGRLGDCYLQMATVDAKQYDRATNQYQKVLLSPNADVKDRSQAEMGLALALKEMARLTPAQAGVLLDAAFLHYTNILYEKNLRDGEVPDPFWLKEAGLAAAKLAEGRRQWEAAINIYKRMLAKLPPLRALLEKRIQSAGEQWRLEKS